jgi:hypothetical protein
MQASSLGAPQVTSALRPFPATVGLLEAAAELGEPCPMTVQVGPATFLVSKRWLLGFPTSALVVAFGLVNAGRHSEPYTGTVFYLMAGAVLLLGASFVPSIIWPGRLRLTHDGIVWLSSLGLKTRFSARWADLDGVGLHRPQTMVNLPVGGVVVNLPVGGAKDRPAQIGFRFKNGRLPQVLKEKGAGVTNFGQWDWVIPGTWDAPPDIIVAECEKHLSAH